MAQRKKIRLVDARLGKNPNIDRQIIGLKPTSSRGKNIKDMTWPEAKKAFPRLSPTRDSDGDGYPNENDCTPFDSTRQNWFTDAATAAANAAKAAAAAAQAKAAAAAKAIADAAAAAKAAAAKAVADAAAKAKADAAAAAKYLAEQQAKAKAIADAKAAAEAQAKAQAQAKAAADAAAAKAAADAAAQAKAQAQAKAAADAAAQAKATSVTTQVVESVKSGVAGAIGGLLGTVQSVLPTTPKPAEAPTPTAVVPTQQQTFTSQIATTASKMQEIKPLDKVTEVVTYIPDKITTAATSALDKGLTYENLETKMTTGPVRADVGTTTYIPVIPIKTDFKVEPTTPNVIKIDKPVIPDTTTPAPLVQQPIIAPKSVITTSELKQDITGQTFAETVKLQNKVEDLKMEAQKELQVIQKDIVATQQAKIDAGKISVEQAQAAADKQLAAATEAINKGLQKDVNAAVEATNVKIETYQEKAIAEASPIIKQQQIIEQKSDILPQFVAGAIRGATYAIPYAGTAVLAADTAKLVQSIPEEISFLKTGGAEAVKAETTSLLATGLGIAAGGAAASALKPTITDIPKPLTDFGTKVDSVKAEVASTTINFLADTTSKLQDTGASISKGSSVTSALADSFLPKPAPSTPKSDLLDYGLIGKVPDVKPLPTYDVVAPKPTAIQTEALNIFKTPEPVAPKSTLPEISIPSRDLAQTQQMARLKSGADVLLVNLDKGTAQFRSVDNLGLPTPEALKAFDKVVEPKLPGQTGVPVVKYEVIPKEPSIQELSLIRLKESTTKSAMESAAEARLRMLDSGTTKPIFDITVPAKDLARTQEAARLKSGADVLAVDLTKGTAKIRPSDNPFGIAKPEAMTTLDKLGGKGVPRELTLQEISLANIKAQTSKAKESPGLGQSPFKPAKSIKTINDFKSPGLDVPPGYKAVGEGGMLMLVKEEAVQKKIVQQQQPKVFQILSKEQMKQLKNLEEQRLKVKVESTSLGENRFASLAPGENIFGTIETKSRFPSTIGENRFTQMLKEQQKPKLRQQQLLKTVEGVKVIKGLERKAMMEVGLKGGQFMKALRLSQRMKMRPLETVKIGTTQALGTISLVATQPKTDTLQKKALLSKTLLGQRSQIAADTMTRLKQDTRTRQAEVAREKIKLIPFLKTQDESQRRLAEQSYIRKGGGFDVFVKRRGKLEATGVSYTKEQAALLAKKRLTESLAATAYIRATGRAATKSSVAAVAPAGAFRQYRIVKGKKIFDPTMYIQESKFRLGTRAEKTEIQVAKAAASQAMQKNKRRSGGFFLF